jgi:hypothetical protein
MVLASFEHAVSVVHVQGFHWDDGAMAIQLVDALAGSRVGRGSTVEQAHVEE